MKTNQIPQLLLFAGLALLFAPDLKAQDENPADSTGLPGDHFSLEGAIELFKKAESPEHFEKLLNTIRHLEKDRYQTRSFAYIDIISWTESKVYNKTMSEVIQEKYRTSKRRQ